MRGAGDSRGQDVSDPLLSTLPALRERGRVELDSNDNIQPVELQTVFRPGVRLGQTVQVIDELQGVSWRGKVVGIRHITGGGILETALSIMRAGQ